MDRTEIFELHYIAPLANLGSILRLGILSHTGAAAVDHESVAEPTVQMRRNDRAIAGGLPLHQYVNLYFWARNAMMYRVRTQGVCVVAIDPRILDLPGTYVSTANAASERADFHALPAGLALIDRANVYRRDWTTDEERQRMQAEVLVPDSVPPEYIRHVYVRDAMAEAVFRREHEGVALKQHEGLFFDT